MRVSVNVDLLPMFTTLCTGAARVTRKDKAIRMHHESLSPAWLAKRTDSVRGLLRLGHEVRLYIGRGIWTAKLSGERVLWSVRNTFKARRNVVVEVAL